jgi:LmbE family N-acetylglucosaminyl deacetylase
LGEVRAGDDGDSREHGGVNLPGAVPVDPAEAFPGTVVVLAPHMDDEILACGGTLAQLPDKERIHVAFATDGSRSPVPTFQWQGRPATELPAIRRDEAAAALGVLGIGSERVDFWDLPDGALARHTREMRQQLAILIDRVRPDSIFTPFRFDRHPDHLALHRATLWAASRGVARVAIVEYFVYYRWALISGGDVRRFMKPGLLMEVDVSSEADRKLEALHRYRSQTTLFYPWQDRPILPAERVAEVCRTPEYFLRYDAESPGASVFARSRRWIRLVHAVEPMLKRRKEEVLALLRARRPVGPDSTS